MDIISKSEALIPWIDEQVAGLEVSHTTRDMIVSGFYDVALEHHRAIIQLAKLGYYGSAFALGRCIFESFVRGVWFQYCAEDDHIRRYRSGKFEFSISQFIKEVEKLEGYRDKVLSETKKTGWNTLNQYMHSGYLQIARRYTDEQREPNYAFEEVAELLNFANSYALLSTMEMAQLCGRSELTPFLEKFIEFRAAEEA